MFYLAIILTIFALGLLFWAESHQRAGWHLYAQTASGLLWLAGAIFGFISLGLLFGIIFQVAIMIIGGLLMPISSRK